ncbi:hypothetical protein [Nostoc sp.]|uniref:hypothetical protein n=1 Tax=Nostoc sp. TaxID=1180 RepID=UPI002FF513E8
MNIFAAIADQEGGSLVQVQRRGLYEQVLEFGQVYLKSSRGTASRREATVYTQVS